MRLFIPLMLPLLALSAAKPSPAAIRESWIRPYGMQVGVLAIGELDGDASLEIVAPDETGQLAVISSPDGAVDFVFPPPWSFASQPDVHVHDLDEDGLGELVLVASAPERALAVYDHDGGTYVELWSLADFTTQGLDFLDMQPEPGREIIVTTPLNHLEVYDGVTGLLLFDSRALADVPPNPTSIAKEIADFDADELDEILAVFFDSETVMLMIDNDGAAGAPFDPDERGLEVTLLQNAPNPTFGSTTLGFDLPLAGRVRLRIFDAAGRLITTLADGELSAGRHELRWDGRDSNERMVASGVYFYEIEVEGQRLSRKLLRVR